MDSTVQATQSTPTPPENTTPTPLPAAPTIEPSEPTKRPILITIFCVIGFLSIVLILSGLLIPAARQEILQNYGSLFILIAFVQTTAGLIAFVGLWKMRKWGVYMYAIQAVLGTIYGIVSGVPFQLLPLIIPLVIIIIGFMNLKKMS